MGHRRDVRRPVERVAKRAGCRIAGRLVRILLGMARMNHDERRLGCAIGVMMSLVACKADAPRTALPALAISAHIARHGASLRDFERFEDQACVDLSRTARAACPLVDALTLKVIPGGIRIHVDPSRADEIVARMRCHMAFSRARGFPREAECPLYLRGVEIALSSERDAVEITSGDPEITHQLVDSAVALYGR
jgi:hypothetical protein